MKLNTIVAFFTFLTQPPMTQFPRSICNIIGFTSGLVPAYLRSGFSSRSPVKEEMCAPGIFSFSLHTTFLFYSNVPIWRHQKSDGMYTARLLLLPLIEEIISQYYLTFLLRIFSALVCCCGLCRKINQIPNYNYRQLFTWPARRISSSHSTANSAKSGMSTSQSRSVSK